VRGVSVKRRRVGARALSQRRPNHKRIWPAYLPAAPSPPNPADDSLTPTESRFAPALKLGMRYMIADCGSAEIWDASASERDFVFTRVLIRFGLHAMLVG
jgi:hypothetical protein